MIHIDTHIAIWLFNAETERLSAAATATLSENLIGYSPMIRHELDLLEQRDRLPAPSASAILRYLGTAFAARESGLAFDTIIDASQPLVWTRDPFDRLIVATAIAEGVPLITADRDIRDNFENAVW